MKKISLIIFSIIFATACTSVKQIGKVNMISNRNVDPNFNYQLISSYSGGSDKEIRKTRSRTIEDAIDQTVKKVPGGEFVMNAKIYLVDGIYFAIEGDVWGATGEVSYRGFKTLDKVTWKKLGTINTGTITALKDDKTCYVKVDNSNQTVELSYNDITKTKINVPINNNNSNSQSNQSNKSNSINGFIVGDKVKFNNVLGITFNGKIINLDEDIAIIEYQKKSGKL
jgi:hypothetical protein